ncbi:MAG TPA: hypothetical protein VK699_13325 [Terriglobales bacterium]|nr:hypothetical protein [Terriglobales bacterium]
MEQVTASPRSLAFYSQSKYPVNTGIWARAMMLRFVMDHIMRKEYLHISADACENCKGPVVAGWLAVRESEIEKETQIRRVGVICLSCGHRPERISEPVNALQFTPVEWKYAVKPQSHGQN